MIQRLETPDDVEAAFYEAFETADLSAMRAVWADVRGIICVHPLGEPLVGPRAVLGSWEEMFAKGPEMHFRVRLLQQTRTEDLATHLVSEHIRVSGEAEERPPVIATNIYRYCSGGWRMIVHHASPIPDRRSQSRQRIH